MIEIVRYCISTLPFLLPFLLLAFLLFKVNLKPINRAYQILMPIFSLVFVIAVSVIQVLFYDTISELIRKLVRLIRDSAPVQWIMNQLAQRGIELNFNFGQRQVLVIIFCIAITLAMIIYIIYKAIAIRILKAACKNGGMFVEMVQHPMYVRSDEDHATYLRMDRTRSRGYMKVFYIATVLLLTLFTLVSCYFFREEELNFPVMPLYAIIMVGELAFMLGGVTREEATGEETGEDDDAQQIGSYAMMRDVLRKLFADKLSAEDTVNDNGILNFKTNDEVIEALEEDGRTVMEAYAHFMQGVNLSGAELDHNYVNAGKELLEGHSILFNNPFYYDLIPYIFYPMNRQLLTHHKVLVVLGRLGTEDEIINWCQEGLTAVNNTPSLWRVGLMDSSKKDLDVGILTRSMVQDLPMHEANAQFFSQVGMMVILEPSRLLTTAQIGLNSLVRYCSTEEHKPVFCSIDKNCDGLLDALCHVLMVSLSEVSAMSHPAGQSSYMCWDGDSEHLQHRMLPNISRYLGFGTELSIAAVKNQILQTWWYGGDGFPVQDIRWIAGQYYYDLLDYASMPASQETLDECFHVSSRLWDARQSRRLYLTVEDDSNNLFEIKRDFSTRATEEGFINVISQDYLLKDYMTDNDRIFSADPKAIPYVVADYAHTARNVALRLCLRMSVGRVWESDLVRELELIDASTDEPVKSLWKEICAVNNPRGSDEGNILRFVDRGKERFFTEEVIRCRRKYNIRTGRMENSYYVEHPDFIRLYVRMLQNAEYIAEDEQGNKQYLGSEILGQIYQGHLPGQFLTIAGKHYEMLHVTSDNRVVLRRAADHITGRTKYRQVREYTLSHLMPDSRMGSSRRRDGLSVDVLYADVHVSTPAYWVMDRYNDFTTAKKIQINGVPDRDYYNKRVIRIGFEGGTEEVTPEICRTLTILMNEVFVTLYAENQCFIQALMPGAEGIPLTYTLHVDDETGVKKAGISAEGDDTGVEYNDSQEEHDSTQSENGGNCTEQNCIYIVEDCQLDIGLIESVQRNLDRIFAIICDYLDWHGTQVELSKNPPPEKEPDEAEVPKPVDLPKKKGFFGRLGDKIKGLFGGRKKKNKPETAETENDGTESDDTESGATTAVETAEGTAAGTENAGGTVVGVDTAENRDADTESTDSADAADATMRDEMTESDDAAETDKEDAADDKVQTETDADDKAQTKTDEDDKSQTKMDADDRTQAESDDNDDDEDDEGEYDGNPIMASIAYTGRKMILTSVSSDNGEEVPVTENSADTGASEGSADVGTIEDAADAETIKNGADAGTIEDSADAGESGNDTETSSDTEDISYEPDEAKTVHDSPQMPTRKPYHERYYLLYGGTAEPEGLAIAETLSFLRDRGYGNSELRQARDGQNLAELIESGSETDQKGGHYCDFCGTPLSGTEYEVLSDGRERCMMCSRTAIRTEAEFRKVYHNVINGLQRYYGITINAPIKVEMVNAKKLHRALGKTFVPTGNADGRVLGVAISSGKGYRILLENGSPRLASAMTMAHELTHIWQYLNWDQKAIRKQYGKSNELLIYEGMAKWSEIQYAYLINESGTAKREELMTRMRDDEYGQGFLLYVSRYPLSHGTTLKGETPFMNNPPL